MTRTEEIKNSIRSFSKEEGYTKKEYLPELLKLQNELVEVAFGKESTCRLFNVLGKYNALSKANGNIAETECNKLYQDVSVIDNQIKAEISGNKGEYKAFRSLETLMCEHRIVKNVSLMHGDHRTELDAVVITGKAIFVVEVKNTKRDIRIDNQGNYYRMSYEGEHYDSNIGEKMNDKVYLLKTALEDAGIKDIKIESLVVFTNYRINVTNDYPYIRTCFLSDLPKIIDSYNGSKVSSRFEFDALEGAIMSAESMDLFKAPVDIEALKDNLATLISKIEDAENNPRIRRTAKVRNFFNKIQRVASAAAMFVIGG